MLAIVVFVLSNGLASVVGLDETEQVRLELPAEVARFLVAENIREITTMLWGRRSFSSAVTLGSDAGALIDQERAMFDRLKHPCNPLWRLHPAPTMWSCLPLP